MKNVFLLLAAFLMSGCARVGLSVINGIARTGDFDRVAQAAYGNDELQQLDVYRPSDSGDEAALPVVVFFYGGCWGGCKTYDKSHYLFVADALTQAGYIAVIADYRLYPEVFIKPILEDTAAAVEWTRQHISTYGGDADNIFVMGHSAGAHMAAMVAVDKQWLQPSTRSALAGFIGLAGPYDFLPLTEAYQEILFGPPDHFPATQPVNFVDGTQPPMLLLWGTDDTTIYPRNISNMAEKIRAEGGTVVAETLAGINHVGILSALARPLRSGKPVMSAVRQFIEQTSKQ